MFMQFDSVENCPSNVNETVWTFQGDPFKIYRYPGKIYLLITDTYNKVGRNCNSI